MAKKGEKNNKKTKQEPKTFESAALDIISFARESQAPIVSERIQKTKDWVFWGEDNLYPDRLIRMADNSALHSAILDTKSKMIAGEGIMFDDNEEQARNFLEEATAEYGGLIKTIEMIAVDVAYFSALSLNVQYNKGGQIGTIKHSDHSFIRAGKMRLESKKIEEYWHSTRWDIATNKRVYSREEEIYRPQRIVAFDPKKMRDSDSRRNGQLITNSRYTPSVIYYAKPNYIGATNYIEVSAKIANFHKNQLDNGMVGNVHLHLKQDLSDAEKRIKLKQELSDQYTGTNNAGRILLTWGVGDSNVPIVTPIQAPNVHEQIADLGIRVNENIVSAHSIPRQLTQLEVKTGLGGLETSEAIDMYQTTQITPDQKLIENTFNNILEFNGIGSKMKIEKLKPSSLILSDSLMSLSATVNEVRDIRSVKPLEDDRGEKLLIELQNGGGSDTDN